MKSGAIDIADQGYTRPAEEQGMQKMVFDKMQDVYKELTPYMQGLDDMMQHQVASLMAIRVLADRGELQLPEWPAKFEALYKLVRDWPSKKFLIFAHYVDEISLLHRFLQERGIFALTLHGSIPREQRPEIIRRMQDQSGVQCLIAQVSDVCLAAYSVLYFFPSWATGVHVVRLGVGGLHGDWSKSPDVFCGRVPTTGELIITAAAERGTVPPHWAEGKCGGGVRDDHSWHR